MVKTYLFRFKKILKSQILFRKQFSQTWNFCAIHALVQNLSIRMLSLRLFIIFLDLFTPYCSISYALWIKLYKSKKRCTTYQYYNKLIATPDPSVINRRSYISLSMNTTAVLGFRNSCKKMRVCFKCFNQYFGHIYVNIFVENTYILKKTSYHDKDKIYRSVSTNMSSCMSRSLYSI